MQATPNEREAIIDSGLERLANAHGDIVGLVMQRYYARYPGARESFRFHGLGDQAALEGSMVEQTIYFLMTWPTEPEQIRIILSESVIRHHDTLEVPPQWYLGMIDVVVELVLEELASDGDAAVRSVWCGLRNELAAQIERARRDCYRAGADEPLPDLTVSLPQQ